MKDTGFAGQVQSIGGPGIAANAALILICDLLKVERGGAWHVSCINSGVFSVVTLARRCSLEWVGQFEKVSGSVA